MGALFSYFSGEDNSSGGTDMQRSETSNSAENSSPNPRSETSDLLQTQNKTTELPDIQTEDTTDGIDSFTTSSDLSAEAEKINIYVRHAGKSKEYDIFPLEKISLLHQEACNYLNKNPEKMALVFEGEHLDLTKTKCQYPQLKRGATVHMIQVR